jgi:hypothetical protein
MLQKYFLRRRSDLHGDKMILSESMGRKTADE